MERTKIESSAFSALAYDASTQTLEIEFHPSKKTGRVAVFQYAPVSQALHDEMRSAPSLGSFLATRILRNPEIQAVDVTDEVVTA